MILAQKEGQTVTQNLKQVDTTDPQKTVVQVVPDDILFTKWYKKCI